MISFSEPTYLGNTFKENVSLDLGPTYLGPRTYLPFPKYFLESILWTSDRKAEPRKYSLDFGPRTEKLNGVGLSASRNHESLISFWKHKFLEAISSEHQGIQEFPGFPRSPRPSRAG